VPLQVLYFCHPERTSVREGSAFLDFFSGPFAVPQQKREGAGFSP
jgi:hypothetical protein